MRLHRRRGRIEAGLALLEGPKLVGEAVAAGHRPDTIFALTDDEAAARWAAESEARLLTVTEAVLARISTTAHPQSPVATIPIPGPVVPDRGHLLAAWGVSDPGNAGALIRVAAAFGIGYCAGPGSADTWGPKVMRAAAGCHFRTTLGTCSTVDELREAGRPIVAAVAHGGDPPEVLHGDAVIVIGSEAHGLPEEVVVAADRLVTIPMTAGVESLNVAAAAAIIAYAATAGGEAS